MSSLACMNGDLAGKQLDLWNILVGSIRRTMKLGDMANSEREWRCTIPDELISARDQPKMKHDMTQMRGRGSDFSTSLNV